jgi:hypothetical protein
MKRMILAAIGCFLTLNLALAGEPSAADQKWMAVVQKMVVEGQNTISTPSQDRIELLKDWAKKNGYTVQVAANDQGYRVTVSKAGSEKLVSR